MTQSLDKFKLERPDISQLIGKYPELSDLLTGTFVSAPNDYTSKGLPIVSWMLHQSKINNPTYGMIGLCDDIEVPTDQNYNEVVHVLEGKLIAEAGGVKGEYERGKEPLITLPGRSLRLTVEGSPVIYFCEYKVTGIAMVINGVRQKTIPFYALNQLRGYSLKEVDLKLRLIYFNDSKGNTLRIYEGTYRVLKQQDYASGKDQEMDTLIQAIDSRLSLKP